MDFRKRTKRLASRKDWYVLQSFWSRHIPSPSDLILDADQESQLTLLVVKELPQADLKPEHRFLPETHPASSVFLESMYSVFKAARVSSAATRQVRDGLATWSISTAYQGAIFALRSLIGLFGIAYIEDGNKGYLVDVAPGPPKGAAGRTSSTLSQEVQVMRVQKMGHLEWWALFQRLQSTWQGVDGLDKFELELARCPAGTFTKHRNDLHYRLTWYFDDLFEDKLTSGSFGVLSTEREEGLVELLGDPRGSDGVLLLNGLLLGVCISLLRTLAVRNRQLDEALRRLSQVADPLASDIVGSWYATFAR